MESPVVLAPTENDPLFVPDAAEFPLIVNQETEDVAVQLSVPEPPFVTLTVWPKGFVPPCTAEKESEAGLRPMTGLKGVGAGGAAAAVSVGVST